MKKSNFTEEQIAFALQQAEHGTKVVEVCRKVGISEQTFYRWKKKYGGMGVASPRALSPGKQTWESLISPGPETGSTSPKRA